MKKKTEKANVAVYIDAENISYKKADSIMKTAKKQGRITSVRVCGLQNDEGTKKWSDTAKELRAKGKQVVLIGEEKAPSKLRNAGDKFIEI